MEICQKERQKIQNPWNFTWLSLLMALFSLFWSDHTTASIVSCSVLAARIVSLEGVVEFRRTGQRNWQRAQLYIELCQGDMLRIRSRSRAALQLSNDSMLRLDQKTTITFTEPKPEKTTLLDLFKGKLHIITRTPKPFKIRTPFVNAGVEGTEFFIGVL